MIAMRINQTVGDLEDLSSFSVWDTPHHLIGQRRYNGLGFPVLLHQLALATIFSRPEAKLWALIHDCHEAITGDIASPVQSFLGGGALHLKNLQEALDHRFCQELGVEISAETKAEVRRYDREIRALEENLMGWQPFPPREEWHGAAAAELQVTHPPVVSVSWWCHMVRTQVHALKHPAPPPPC